MGFLTFKFFEFIIKFIIFKKKIRPPEIFSPTPTYFHESIDVKLRKEGTTRTHIFKIQ